MSRFDDTWIVPATRGSSSREIKLALSMIFVLFLLRFLLDFWPFASLCYGFDWVNQQIFDWNNELGLNNFFVFWIIIGIFNLNNIGSFCSICCLYSFVLVFVIFFLVLLCVFCVTFFGFNYRNQHAKDSDARATRQQRKYRVRIFSLRKSFPEIKTFI